MIIPSPSVVGELGRRHRFYFEFLLSRFLYKTFCSKIWILQLITEPRLMTRGHIVTCSHLGAGICSTSAD